VVQPELREGRGGGGGEEEEEEERHEGARVCVSA
jgi:hypothetical protein